MNTKPLRNTMKQIRKAKTMETDTIKHTIAMMHATDGTGLHQLRDLYPELVTIWDELDDLRESDNNSVTRQEYDDLEEQCD